MKSSRRDFLKRSSVYAAGFCTLQRVLSAGAAFAEESSGTSPYGRLQSDPQEILDLPEGFSYRIISRGGITMSDGFVTPGLPDGMATFPGPDGLTILIRNHELLPNEGPSPFGEHSYLLSRVEGNKLYDPGSRESPHIGGTTTIVYDTQKQQVIRDFLSLTGTCRNCAGGPTPWNSWITCEETVLRQGKSDEGDYFSERDHGYNFEVPARAEISLGKAVPLKEMGRFNHEAIAVDPDSGIVYQTEDRDDGLIYRYVPNKPGELAAGGKLQALVIKQAMSADTRNWETQEFAVGERLAIEWLDLEDIQSPDDDLRQRGFDAGAARFARGEGMWYSQGQIFFACTNGGRNQTGQIWKLHPSEDSPDGWLELFIEPNDSELVEAADNLTVAPWGDLMVCEDRDGEVVRLVGVTPDGRLYTFAANHLHTEFAGVTFSPDGSTLFVNLQHRNLTLAITGPWQRRV